MLDKQSPVPIYIQIEEQLKQQIRQGDFPITTAIPFERELTERQSRSPIWSMTAYCAEKKGAARLWIL